MHLKGFFVSTAFLSVTLSVHAQVPKALDTTDRADPFIQYAENLYQQFLTAQKNGDVPTYTKLRTKEVNNVTVRHLEKIGKPLNELGPMLTGLSEHAIDLASYDFIRSDSKPGVARLLYKREGRNQNGQSLDFAVFMLWWEEESWRIGWVGGSFGDKYFEGKERTAKVLLNDPKFSLQ